MGDGCSPLAVLITLGYALYASHRMFGRLYDDTHITLRYAENFADGDGLRFNPGQQPVEGYTNFLLTVFLAGCAKIGLPLVAMTKIVSIGCGARRRDRDVLARVARHAAARRAACARRRAW